MEADHDRTNRLSRGFESLRTNWRAHGVRPVRSRQADNMTRWLFVVPLVLMASLASAQQGRDACARDVSRFCRRVINDGDTAVLSCLQQNRRRLSKACDKILT